jgi:hypothetical protein
VRERARTGDATSFLAARYGAFTCAGKQFVRHRHQIIALLYYVCPYAARRSGGLSYERRRIPVIPCSGRSIPCSDENHFLFLICREFVCKTLELIYDLMPKIGKSLKKIAKFPVISLF